MQKVHYSIFIKAPREKVWEIMLGEDTYRDWTSVFHPGSYYKGSWDKGSKMLFIGPDEKGGGEAGMVAEIADNRYPEYISIKHIGVIANGQEDTESEEAKKWAPAYENYTFQEKDDGTEVLIDTDILEEHKEMFAGLWPKALARLKEICENTSN